MSPTNIEIQTDISISYASLKGRGNVLPQQKCSAKVILSGWGLKRFERPSNIYNEDLDTCLKESEQLCSKHIVKIVIFLKLKIDCIPFRHMPPFIYIYIYIYIPNNSKYVYRWINNSCPTTNTLCNCWCKNQQQPMRKSFDSLSPSAPSSIRFFRLRPFSV